MIQHISAVTFAVRDMARSVEFYQKLGFELLYGGERAAFSSLKAGGAFVNLSTSPGYEPEWPPPRRSRRKEFRTPPWSGALPSKSTARAQVWS